MSKGGGGAWGGLVRLVQWRGWEGRHATGPAWTIWVGEGGGGAKTAVVGCQEGADWLPSLSCR